MVIGACGYLRIEIGVYGGLWSRMDANGLQLVVVDGYG